MSCGSLEPAFWWIFNEQMTEVSPQTPRITELRRQRPRSILLRLSCFVVLGLIIWAWLASGPLLGRLSHEQRWRNFWNFVADLQPGPARRGEGWDSVPSWALELMNSGGWEAMGNTFAISLMAILIAAVVVLPTLLCSSRRLAARDSLGIFGGQGQRIFDMGVGVIGTCIRGAHVLARAIPEYLLAFLLLSLLGPQVWPLILALAIHNFGILGRLWGEVLENADMSAARQARLAGAGRIGVFTTVLLPELFNRLLVFFFYRWETCVKDATVLGMLGLLTLGKLIMLAKGFFWDEMIFYVLLSASLIWMADLLTGILRSRLRQAQAGV